MPTEWYEGAGAIQPQRCEPKVGVEKSRKQSEEEKRVQPLRRATSLIG